VCIFENPVRLPSSISPCPIKESVSEIRFKANVPDDAVFGIVYQVLKHNFSNVQQLPIMDLPSEFRTGDRSLQFQAYFRLENENQVALIGPRMIAVGMRGDYPGWQQHSSNLKSILTTCHSTGIIERISRMGLRYINFFSFDIFPKLRLRFSIGDTNIEGAETSFKTVLKAPDCNTLLQLRKDVALSKQPGKTGSVIDIDCFLSDPAGEFGAALQGFLEKAHTAEKKMFFELLTPDFLATLNPAYTDGN
jgi:uncharacterized protein (TIGR04255 family)